MTDWVPDITGRKGPRYKRIVAALEADIAEGRLSPGTRLPTHRALADALGLTTGTVTRAYKEAERRGLVYGHVGRGTFVGPPPEGEAPQPARETGQAAPQAPPSRASARPISLMSQPATARPQTQVRETPARQAPTPSGPPYDLAEVVPAQGPQAAVWNEVLAAIAARPDELDARAADAAAGKAGARWVSRAGLAAMPERMLATAGGGAALTAALASVAAPGETVLCESLTYPGLAGVANLLGLNIKPLVSDEFGVRPESFELACWSREGRVLYCMPSLQTPNNTTMPPARREELVRIARKYDAYIVEDDVFGPLASEPPAPIARIAPDRALYVASMAKCLDPALRVGFLVPPDALAERVSAVLRATGGRAAPLSARSAARWMDGGHADSVLEWQRAESEARQRAARESLGAERLAGAPGALQLWLRLPEPWRAEEFAARCAEQQVQVASAARFAAGRAAPPHAARLGLGGARTREDWAAALSVLARILASPPGVRPGVLG